MSADEGDKLIETGAIKKEGLNDDDGDDPIFIISSSDEEDRPPAASKKEEKLRVVNKKTKADVFIVEKILKHKRVGSIIVYKVKWEGFSYQKCTWEPTRNFNDFSLIEEYFLQKLNQ